MFVCVCSGHCLSSSLSLRPQQHMPSCGLSMCLACRQLFLLALRRRSPMLLQNPNAHVGLFAIPNKCVVAAVGWRFGGCRRAVTLSLPPLHIMNESRQDGQLHWTNKCRPCDGGERASGRAADATTLHACVLPYLPTTGTFWW